MNRYKQEYRNFNDIDIFQKDFENRFASGFEEVFQNGEFHPHSSQHFVFDYNENYNEVFKSDNLSRKTKVLIALAVASAIYQPYCMDAYRRDALDNGWTEEQIAEAMKVAAAIRSGFSAVHAVQKMNDIHEMVLI